MVGEDSTSSQLAEPPLKPLLPGDLDQSLLRKLASRVIEATWKKKLLTQWSWGEGVYLLSQIRYHQISGEKVPQEIIDWYIRNREIKLGHINNVAPGAGAARLARDSKFDGSDIHGKLKDWIARGEGITYASNGALEHWRGSVWADTCYMMGSYYLNLGVAENRADYIGFVGKQLSAHIELLQHREIKLYAHGSYEGKTFWNFWGRGNAWMALSCIEYLDACEALSIRDENYSHILEALRNQLQALAPLLPDYGIWDVLVDRQIENRGVLETSATAGLGSAYIRAARYDSSNSEIWHNFGKRVIASALTYIDETGVLTRTSAGTVLQLIPFGYSVIKDDRPQLWGQGLALQAITSFLYPSANQITLA